VENIQEDKNPNRLIVLNVIDKNVKVGER